MIHIYPKTDKNGGRIVDYTELFLSIDCIGAENSSGPRFLSRSKDGMVKPLSLRDYYSLKRQLIASYDSEELLDKGISIRELDRLFKLAHENNHIRLFIDDKDERGASMYVGNHEWFFIQSSYREYNVGVQKMQRGRQLIRTARTEEMQQFVDKARSSFTPDQLSYFYFDALAERLNKTTIAKGHLAAPFNRKEGYHRQNFFELG